MSSLHVFFIKVFNLNILLNSKSDLFFDYIKTLTNKYVYNKILN